MAKTIAVLGAGNAGTTFALLATHNANEVRLWTIEEDVADAMRQHRENRKYLPGVALPAEIAIEVDLQKAVAGADIVMLAVPSHIVRRLTRAIAPFLMADQIILDVAKGIEEKTFYMMSEVMHSELSGAVRHNIVALSGPSIAREMSQGVPTAVAVGGFTRSEAGRGRPGLGRPTFPGGGVGDMVGGA